MPDEATARAELLHLVRRAPRLLGAECTRWTLAAIREAVPWLAERSLSGIWRLLARFGIAHKGARDRVPSPDPRYEAKRAAIAASRAASRAGDGRVVTLFLDEVSVGRQPTRAAAWEARGAAVQPLAERAHAADAATRVVAALDAADGRVLARRRTKITVPALVGFFREVAAAYPEAARIDVVLDNWPVHFHPDLLAALAEQDTPFAFPVPGHWPTEPSAAAVRKWGELKLPIRFVPLPTYASWLNPIEKLWRRLRQEVTHLHPWAADPPALHAAIDAFLARFAPGSDAGRDLLRYVGLELPD